MQKMFRLLLVIFAVTLVNAVDYCKLCGKGETHVKCHEEYYGIGKLKLLTYTWDFSEPSKFCTSYRKYKLTEDEKNFIVKYHNDKRRLVASGNETRGARGPQPAAVNIPDLEWDEELEMLAKQLTYQCGWKYSFVPTYQCSNVERFKVGQNIGIIDRYDYNVQIVDTLNSWYNEVDRFNSKYVDRYRWDESTRHYTQMIWAGTTKIGCAYIQYELQKHRVVNRFVCNYGPSGNRGYQPVYIRKK